MPGVRLHVIDRGGYDPTRVAVTLLAAIRGVHPDSLRFRGERFDRLAGGAELRQALLAGRAPPALLGSWGGAPGRVRRARAQDLLYLLLPRAVPPSPPPLLPRPPPPLPPPPP